MTPTQPTQSKSASERFPLPASLGRQHGEKDVLVPDIKGLTELFRVQVGPVFNLLLEFRQNLQISLAQRKKVEKGFFWD